MSYPSARSTYTFDDLIAIMRALRTPETGCAWDLKQDFASIAPYTIEEAYEVADAIERGAFDELVEELGDLLLQVVFHARIGADKGLFAIDDVITAICRKMIRRHPHVFGPQAKGGDGQATWETIKDEERQASNHDQGALSGIAIALPALLRAEKLQKRAARTGFDWPDPAPVFAKIAEEMAEVRTAMASDDKAGIEEEIGDFLFAAVNLARHLQIDPETALRRANMKFESRFQAMETVSAKMGLAFEQMELKEQEKLWQRVKKQEKAKA